MWKRNEIEAACLVLNLMFCKVPTIDGDESGTWWEAELRDKNVPIRWDEDSGLFIPEYSRGIKGKPKQELLPGS